MRARFLYWKEEFLKSDKEAGSNKGEKAGKSWIFFLIACLMSGGWVGLAKLLSYKIKSVGFICKVWLQGE